MIVIYIYIFIQGNLHISKPATMTQNAQTTIPLNHHKALELP